MMKQNRKESNNMAKPAVRKAEATAEEHLTDLFTSFVEKQVSSLPTAEARARKKRVDKLIDEALASRPKRRGTR